MERRSFLRLLFSVLTSTVVFSRSIDKTTESEEFIIVEGWVLKKKDFDDL